MFVFQMLEEIAAKEVEDAKKPKEKDGKKEKGKKDKKKEIEEVSYIELFFIG